MAKVRVAMRLYRVHDLDLINFIQTHELDFKKAMYCALKSFTKGEPFCIEIPPKREADDEFAKKKNYLLTVFLDPEKDAEELALLDKIVSGKRNNFLKNLLRLYLCNPLSESFLKDESDADMFFEKFDIFRRGKRMVNLNQYKKKELNSIFKENGIGEKKLKNIEKDDKLSDNSIIDTVKEDASFSAKVKKALEMELSSKTDVEEKMELNSIPDTEEIETSVEDTRNVVENSSENISDDEDNSDTSMDENIFDMFSSMIAEGKE